MKTKPTIFKEKLEKFNYKILTDERYKNIVKKEIGGKHGIYVLYNKKGNIYYIGKANAIMKRIKQHKNDRHSKKWDTFSVFLTKQANYLDHLEDAFISITEPKGNNQNRRTVPSMTTRIIKAMKKADNEYRNKIYGEKPSKLTNTVKLNSKKKLQTKITPKKELHNSQDINPFNKTVVLKKVYKDKEYQALWLASGKVKYNGKLYKNRYAVAKEIVQKVSGRSTVYSDSFWKIKIENKWISLSKLKLSNKKQKQNDNVKLSNKKQSAKSKTKKHKSILENYFSTPRPLRMKYKNKIYNATLLTSGEIKYENKTYKAPSPAAEVIVNTTTANGWTYWEVKDNKNNWIKLSDLRLNSKKT